MIIKFKKFGADLGILGYREFKTIQEIKNVFKVDDCLMIFKTVKQATYLCKGNKNDRHFFRIIIDDISVEKPIVKFTGSMDRFEILTDIPYNEYFGKFFINGRITIFYSKNLVNKEKVMKFMKK
jgi:hypothetical protein